MSGSAWRSRSRSASCSSSRSSRSSGCWPLPSGLLIGYYANQRSNRRAGPWGADPRQRAVRRARHRADGGGAAARGEGAVLLRRQRLPRRRVAGGPIACASGRRTACTSATCVDAGPRAGARGGRRDRRGIVHARSTGRSSSRSPGLIVLVTTVGGLGGGVLYGVFRPKPAPPTGSRGRRPRLRPRRRT